MSLPLETAIILAAFFGNTVAVVVGAFLTARYGQRAQKATEAAAALAVKVATDAALATSKAQEDAATAQTQALDAAKQLVETAKSTNSKLEDVVIAAKSTGDALKEISKTGKATHTIVNSDRSVMLASMALLTKRIAKENPNDEDAQQAARLAATLSEAARIVNLDPDSKV